MNNDNDIAVEGLNSEYSNRKGRPPLDSRPPWLDERRGRRVSGRCLYGAGFRTLEVPLNSPGSFFARHSTLQGPRYLPTVWLALEERDHGLSRSASARRRGLRIHSSRRTRTPLLLRGRLSAWTWIASPGPRTPSEVFAAIGAGARSVKIFPRGAGGDCRAQGMDRCHSCRDRTSFPLAAWMLRNMGAWLHAGATGFGIGSSLFKAGITVEPKTIPSERSWMTKAFEEALAYGRG